MKKKWLMLLMILSLTLGGVPCIARAEETYTVYVGGQALSISEAEEIYYVNGDAVSGTVTRTEPATWNAKLWYDMVNAQLTLEINNLDASGTSDASDAMHGAGIYSEAKLSLIVKGQNNVHGLTYGTSKTIYGIYAKEGLSISEQSTGKLKVTTEDSTKANYGIYSQQTVNVLAGELEISGGASTTASNSGIYAKGEVNIGSSVQTPKVTVTLGNTRSGSTGIYGYKGITIYNGTVKVTTGYATGSGYCDGLLANSAKISIQGGDVNVCAPGSDQYVPGNSGITANTLEITGGKVYAKGGSSASGTISGIYVNYDIKITGGTVEAVSDEVFGDASFGINSWKGNITISGADTVVKAFAGAASFNAGLSCEKGGQNASDISGNLRISDGAKVYASTSDTNKTHVFSYAILVSGNCLIEGKDTYVEAVAGHVSNETNSHAVNIKRSVGIYLGCGLNYQELDERGTGDMFVITGGTVIAKSLDPDNGEIPAEGTSTIYRHYSYAIGMYDVDTLEFNNAEQTNGQWYRWRTGENDAYTLSMDTTYSEASERYSANQYLEIRAIDANVSPEESETESEPESETESEPESETESEPESETESEPESETESEPESETESEPESETESEPESETESEPESETESEPESETESEPENETEIPRETETPRETLSGETEIPKETETPRETLSGETEIPRETETSRKPQIPSETEPRTEDVSTGDDTNLMVGIYILSLSACVLFGIIGMRKKFK